MATPAAPGGPGPSPVTFPRPPAITNRVIFALAWPVVTTNLLMSAVTWVDLYMVGRLGKEELAAVGLSNFVLHIFIIVLMAVSQGTATVVARAYGANDRRGVDQGFQQSLLLGSVLAVIVTALACRPNSSLLYDLFIWCDAAPHVAELGAEYMRIVLYANTAWVISLVCAAALRSTGDTRTPLWLSGTTNVLNIILNYALIFGHFGAPAMGVAGAAWGTAISRGVEAVCFLVLTGSGLLRVRFSPLHWSLDRSTVRRIMAVGLPAGGEQFLMSAGFLLYNKLIASYGTEALAAYQIGVVMLQFSFMPGVGFSVAGTTLVGQWIGAGDEDQAARAGEACAKFAGVFMSALGVVFVIAAGPFARAYLNDATVVPLATVFIRLLAISQPTMAIHFTLSGALRGAADARSPLRAVIISMYLVRLPISLLTVYVLEWDVYWVWIGMVLSHLARAEYMLMCWRDGRWRQR